MLTETWLRDKEIGQLQEELSLGSGLGLFARNRRLKENGVSYSGVAVVWKESVGSFKEVKLKNKEGFELVAAAGSLKGQSRKLVVVACYIPPNYVKARGNLALDYIEGAVIELKRMRYLLISPLCKSAFKLP